MPRCCCLKVIRVLPLAGSSAHSIRSHCDCAGAALLSARRRTLQAMARPPRSTSPTGAPGVSPPGDTRRPGDDEDCGPSPYIKKLLRKRSLKGMAFALACILFFLWTGCRYRAIISAVLFYLWADLFLKCM